MEVLTKEAAIVALMQEATKAKIALENAKLEVVSRFIVLALNCVKQSVVIM